MLIGIMGERGGDCRVQKLTYFWSALAVFILITSLVQHAQEGIRLPSIQLLISF